MVLLHLSIVSQRLAAVRVQHLMLVLALAVLVAVVVVIGLQATEWAGLVTRLIQLPTKVTMAAQARLHHGAVLLVAVVLMP